jgi:steroid delta-isomerase
MESDSEVERRAHRHILHFNAAVTGGDWQSFTEWFAPDATMDFVGVPVPPLRGRLAILDAYVADPPDDTMSLVEATEADGADVVRFAWHRGGGGLMRLTWADDLVGHLRIELDDH